MKKILLIILASLAFATASNTYMFIQGIEGGVQIAGREGSVEVVNMNHGVYIPLDASTGNPSGTRKHKVFEILKAIDKSTPLLYKAAVESQVISGVSIRVYQVSDAGTETVFYQINLSNVRVLSVQTSTSMLEGEPLTLEKVQLIYDRILWHIPEGNIQATDTWSRSN